jgi:hypothetical protein
MAKATPNINNFNAGELSPKVDARTDIEKYYSGCKTMQNMFPLVEGGGQKMPGTVFAAETKDSSKESRLIPFQFSDQEAYVLEFGNLYVRFYRDDGQLQIAYVAWNTATAYALGDLVTEGGNHYRCLEAHTSGTFATDLSDGLWEATGGATDLAYEVPTPYLEADLFGLKTIQSADVMWIFHPSYPTKELARFGDTDWTLTNHISHIGAEMDITDITQADPAVVTCTTVPAPVALDGVDGLEDGDIVYLADIVGMVELNDQFFTVANVVAGAGGTFELVGIDSQTFTAYSSAGTAQETYYGTEDNRPSCGTFFEQRLCMAGSNNKPQTIVFSASADFDTFDFGVDDADAIEYTIGSDRVDRIRWLVGKKFVLVGTTGGAWKIGGTNVNDPITATNVVASKEISSGVKNIDSVSVDNTVFWTSRSGTTVRKFEFSISSDSFIAPDMTRIAKHIAFGDTRALTGIVDMAFQGDPVPLLWCVREDGQLLGMTYESQENIFGWFRLVTDGLYESVAVIDEDAQEDQIWVIVNRTIEGSTVRYVEYFTDFELYNDIDNSFFVHSGKSYEGSGIQVLTGLEHLEGEEVAILMDGVALASETVSGGQVTADVAGDKAAVGLPYTPVIEPMKPSVNTNQGISRGKKQRINALTIILYQSYGVKYGESLSNLFSINLGASSNLFTGDALGEFAGDWDDKATMFITQEGPLPMTLLGIVPEFNVENK